MRVLACSFAVAALALAPASAIAQPAYVLHWGSLGSGPGQFNSPQYMACDRTGNLYVVDRQNHRIQKFDPNGVFLTQWGALGSGDGQFDQPTGIAVDNSNNVYVTDRNNHRVQKFTNEGIFVSKFGSNGSGSGQFSFPSGIAVDGSQYLYVADTGNDRIQRFTPSFAVVNTWGGPGSANGQFNDPAGVVLDRDDRVLVVDANNDRVQRFTQQGSFRGTWGGFGVADGLFNTPSGIGVDVNNNVYVVDQGNSRVQQFTASGAFLTKWGASGSAPGELNAPVGLAVDPDGYIHVVNSGNHRVQKFGLADSAHCVVKVFDHAGPTSFPNLAREYYDAQPDMKADFVLSPFTLTDIQDANLFIVGMPNANLTAGEISAMQSFLDMGGHIWIAGEAGDFVDVNARINTALAALGSGMSIDVTVHDDSWTNATFFNGQLLEHEVTQGVSQVRYSKTGRILGVGAGEAFLRTADLANTIGAEQTIGGGSILLTADNLFTFFPSATVLNTQLFRNFCLRPPPTCVVRVLNNGGPTTFPMRARDLYNSMPDIVATYVSSPFTATDLQGADLFVAYAGPADFTGAEIAAMQSYLDEGGCIWFQGEAGDFVVENARINAALAGLGSSLSLNLSIHDGGGGTSSATKVNGRLLDHPLTQDVAAVLYAKTGGIDGVGPGEPFLLSSNLVNVFGAEQTASHGSIILTAENPLANPAWTATNTPLLLNFCAQHDIAVRVRPADWFHDAFPFNETPGLPGTAAFDTATIMVKTGRNTAPTTGGFDRYVVPGDTLVVETAGDSVRVDLIFRISPGPGNYVAIGNQSSGLRGHPTSGSPHSGTHFWASYKNNPGTYSGPPGNHNPGGAIAMHANSPSGWSKIVWNSARMDTAEINIFPVQAQGIGNPPSRGLWMSYYHESELAARPFLATNCNRCFVVDTLESGLHHANVNCGAGAPYPPSWVTTLPHARTGWNGSVTTTECTKIIPDGLLTPGGHVQYFVRRQDLAEPSAIFRMGPDTTRVHPQPSDGSIDGLRWQHFGALPDRWKEAAFGKNGLGMACLLYVDQDDGGGNERVWKAIADSIGSTLPQDRGKADGYGNVPGGHDVNDPLYFISDRNVQPGTTWDLYQVRGARDPIGGHAGSIGSRLSYRGGGNPMLGKWSRIAPTPDMLNTYYPATMLLTGPQSVDILGPFANHSSDDIALLSNWLVSGNTSGPDRLLWMQGDGIAESMLAHASQAQFLSDFLGVQFVSPDYRTYASDLGSCVDLRVQWPPASGDIFGVGVSSAHMSDVLAVNAPVPGAEVAAYYGASATSPASVFKAHSAALPWLSVTNGWDIARQWGRQCSSSSVGRLAYFYRMLSDLQGLLGSTCVLVGSPSVTLDAPGDGAARIANYFALHNNPVRSGFAMVRFGLSRADLVSVRIYDVSGRLVRDLVNRTFPAGEHEIQWDGRGTHGHVAPRGVYFAQVRFATSRFAESKKIVVLK